MTDRCRLTEISLAELLLDECIHARRQRRDHSFRRLCSRSSTHFEIVAFQWLRHCLKFRCGGLGRIRCGIEYRTNISLNVITMRFGNRRFILTFATGKQIKRPPALLARFQVESDSLLVLRFNRSAQNRAKQVTFRTGEREAHLGCINSEECGVTCATQRSFRITDAADSLA